MEYITLGNSGLLVSRLCMGGCPMGQYGWGEVQEAELIDAVNTAIDHGINFFDTADIYGMGTSEQTLSKALGKRRGQVIIATKFGVRIENGKTFYDNTPAWIEQALHQSLKRLNTDYIDVYQIHYRDGKTPLPTVVETLEKYKQQGKIRHIALSNVFSSDISEIRPFQEHFVSFQDEYSLACRKNEQDIQALSTTLQLTPLTWGSLGQGILTGKYNKDSVFQQDDRRSREIYVNFHGEKFQKNMRIVETMRPIARAHGKEPAAIAIRFILDYISGSVVLCGAKRPSQISSNLEGCDWHLSQEEISTLEEVSR